MLAVWKNVSPDMSTQVFNVIQEFYDEARHVDEERWSVNNIRNLIPFVSFNQIPKMRGCFLYALDHPSMFLDPAEPLTDIPEEDTRQQHLSEAFQGYKWRPKAQLEQYKQSKKANKHVEDNSFRDESLQYLLHITNHVALFHKCDERPCLACVKCGMQRSPYLDLAISMDQHCLFNPTKKENFMGAVMEASRGQKSVKKVIKRRINVATGNVASYSALMNGLHQLVQFQQANALASTLGELHSEKVREKEATAKKKREEQAEKVGKKTEQGKKDEETKERIMPGLEKDVAAGIDVVVTLLDKRLREMLRYYFNHPTSGLAQMKKELVLAAIRKHMEEGSTNHSSNQQEQNQIVLGSAEENQI